MYFDYILSSFPIPPRFYTHSYQTQLHVLSLRTKTKTLINTKQKPKRTKKHQTIKLTTNTPKNHEVHFALENFRAKRTLPCFLLNLKINIDNS